MKPVKEIVLIKQRKAKFEPKHKGKMVSQSWHIVSVAGIDLALYACWFFWNRYRSVFPHFSSSLWQVTSNICITSSFFVIFLSLVCHPCTPLFLHFRYSHHAQDESTAATAMTCDDFCRLHIDFDISLISAVTPSSPIWNESLNVKLSAG